MVCPYFIPEEPRIHREQEFFRSLLGLFAVSNQAGTVVGVSIGGLMLALGGFSLVGVFCLGAAVIAAGVMRLRVRESAEFVQRMAT